jgi:hypothetical protein
MSISATARPRFWRGDLQRWVAAGAIVAVLDISFAATWWVVVRHLISFQRLLQGIASAVLGDAALHGGIGSAALGALLHCAVAFGWALVFLVLVRLVPGLRRTLARRSGVYLLGMPFGVLVWLAMNWVVIPLSHGTPTRIASAWFWGCLVWHAVGVGLPMAVIAKWSPAPDIELRPVRRAR